jgi:hypothetical protein
MPDGNNSQRFVPCNIATSDINGQTLPLGAMAFDSFFFKYNTKTYSRLLCLWLLHAAIKNLVREK